MLTADFREFAQLLNSNQVEYLIVGGYALAAHGHPRYTGDLDFWVGISEQNAQRIVKTLHDFGFASLPLKASDFMVPRQVVQLGYEPGRIDILTSIDGVEFDDCYPRRLVVSVDGLALAFIGLGDFKVNKASTGRPKDAVDLRALR
jgi:hypothetical protein